MLKLAYQGINKLWPKLELAMSSDFHYYESRATICESILKIHIKRSFVGNRFKQKTFVFNLMLIYFLLFN